MRPLRDEISELFPDLAAPRLFRAVAASLAPVPPVLTPREVLVFRSLMLMFEAATSRVELVAIAISGAELFDPSFKGRSSSVFDPSLSTVTLDRNS